MFRNSACSAARPASVRTSWWLAQVGKRSPASALGCEHMNARILTSSVNADCGKLRLQLSNMGTNPFK
jgi:hypothetical protein